MSQLATIAKSATFKPLRKPPALVACALYQRQFSVKFTNTSLQGRAFTLELHGRASGSSQLPSLIVLREVPAPGTATFRKGTALVDKNGRACWTSQDFALIDSFGYTTLDKPVAASEENGQLSYICEVPLSQKFAKPLLRQTAKRLAANAPSKLTLTKETKVVLAKLLNQAQSASASIRRALEQLDEAREAASELSKASGGILVFDASGDFSFKPGR